MSKQIVALKIPILIQALRADGESGLADRIENLTGEYLIWDRMILRLERLLGEIESNHSISDNTLQIARLAREQLRLPKHVDGRGVDNRVEQIAADLKRLGLSQWATRIEIALQGSIGSEVSMALRQTLTSLLLSSVAMPLDLRRRVTEMRDRLSQALS